MDEDDRGIAHRRAGYRRYRDRVPDPPAEDTSPPEPASLITVAPGCQIAADELRWRFVPSGGPGGQHANRAHTRAEVRFDIERSPSLTEPQRALLIERIGPEARAASDQERSQLRNRSIALERLVQRLRAGLREEPQRRKTRVPRRVDERRLESKKRRSETKQSRAWRADE
ncbi:MAG: aminoacyl-tRNA hydrolase [Actinobacteria bacterium]|nr:aminoacyl-tRNA hydrolase [Actinomycetota bacterium]